MTRSILLQLRRRLMMQTFWDALATALLSAGAFLVLVVILYRPVHVWAAILGFSLLAAVSAALWTGIRRPSLLRVAVLMDKHARTQDRLTTALAFEGSGDAMQVAALAECQAYLKAFDVRRWTPFHFPTRARWLVIPAILIGAMQLLPHSGALGSRRGEANREANPSVMHTAAKLDELAHQLQPTNKEQASKELQKVADALKKSANQLRAEAKSDAPEKATLRELSSMEELIKSLQEGAAMDALGDALSKVQDARQAAAALKKHDRDAAADKLEQLGKRLVEGKNQQQKLKELAKALANAASQTGGGLSSAASSAAKSAQSGNASETSQALGQMGQSIREGKSSGTNSDSQQMQGLMTKLQEMKDGQEGESKQQKGGQAPKGGIGQVVMQNFGRQGEQGNPGKGGMGPASGNPGSEHDLGSKNSPYGQQKNTAGEAGFKAQLSGILGAGDSLRSLVPTSSSAEASKREYRTLYNALAPAREDALQHDEIPVGSRLFVKRYFEAIRPSNNTQN